MGWSTKPWSQPRWSYERWKRRSFQGCFFWWVPWRSQRWCWWSIKRGMSRGRGGFGRGGSEYGSGRGGSRGGAGGFGSRGRGAPKRKADYGGDYGTPQKRKSEWNSQPIAQQPLGSSSSNYYNDDYSGGDWYT